MNVTGFECAVIGVSGVFPGAKNVEQWWSQLCEGVIGIRSLSHDELEAEGGANGDVIRGGVVDNRYDFDPEFFGYDAQSANIMDPQLRLMHHEVWQALEHAGYPPYSQRHSDETGLFVSAAYNPYWYQRVMQSTPDHLTAVYQANTLLDPGCFATRVAYTLNLKGPAIYSNTACSSSLVCVHQAVNALLSGDCNMAVAGAAYVVPDRRGYVHQPGMILSPDGFCRPFDQSAQGTVWGEGAGFVVLKRLEDALSDHDHIYAVIKGSAINNDGREKAGYTAPGLDGQVKALSRALLSSQLSADDIDFVETHGTGTRLGDPIEIQALLSVYEREQPLLIGAVKANIGHLDAAAGMAGLIKAIFSLHNRYLPPHPAFDKLSNSLEQYAKKIIIPRNGIVLPENKILAAGVSSFGIGGTNAHIILTSYQQPLDAGNDNARVEVFASEVLRESTLSATQELIEDAIRGSIHRNMSSALAKNMHTKLYNQIANPFISEKKSRTALVADTTSGEVIGRCYHKPFDEKPRIVFLFTGQGSQYRGIASELYKYNSTFRRHLDRCFYKLRGLGIIEPHKLLWDTTLGVLNNTAEVQPLLFSIEYAMAHTLVESGIRPDALLGHSLGEWVALCIAGVLTLDDAITLVSHRGRLMAESPDGAMLAFNAIPPLFNSNDQVEVWTAAYNSDRHHVQAGTVSAIAVLSEWCKKGGISFHKLNNRHPFHTPLLRPVADEFKNEILHQSCAFCHPAIPVVSSVDGHWLSDATVTPDYLSNQICQPVNFAKGLEKLLALPGPTIFVEVGPGAGLLGFCHAMSGWNPQRHATCRTIKGRQESISDDGVLQLAMAEMMCLGVSLPQPTISVTYPTPRRAFNQATHLPSSPVPLVKKENVRHDPVERLANCWSSILGSLPTSESDFWQAGGTSLTALTLIAEMSAIKGEEISSDYLYEFSKFDDLVNHLKGSDQKVIEPLDVLSILQDCWFRTIGQRPESNSNFWMSGGSSLSALSFSALLAEKLNLNVGLEHMYDYPVFSTLYDYLKSGVVNASKYEKSETL